MIQRWLNRLLGVTEPKGDCALVLSGGGARAAYQAGVLEYIAQAFPDARFPVLTGVSAGAINTAHLANHTGGLGEAVSYLQSLWNELRTEHVFEAESSMRMLLQMLRRGKPDHEGGPAHFSLVDTTPLRAFLAEKLKAEDGVLTGVETNLKSGRLQAYALTTLSYTTGQTVTWVQGRDFDAWERPNRLGIKTQLTVEHIMASAALPLLFPAVRIDKAWYGDGGIRMTAPLAPALHLGADRILAISTRYDRTRAEANAPDVVGYPPVARVASLLMNAVFLDTLDQDAMMLERINELLLDLPRRRWNGLRPVELLLMRPSEDLGRLAGSYEHGLDGVMDLLARLLGSGETKSPDWLSMLLFESDYVSHLMEIGYKDAHRQRDRLAAFLER